MPCIRPALVSLLALALSAAAGAQFIPGVTATSGMGTFSTYNIQNLTNGQGLSAMNLNGTHSNVWQDMWITNAITTGWLQFDLGSVQPLAGIAVWNYNSSISTARGIALMDVSLSTDGSNWTFLSRESVPQANASAALLPYIIGTGGLPARHVRFDVLQNHGNNYTGLSEVQFVAASSGTIGSNVTLGQGCIRERASFYESFQSAAAFDLANGSFSMIPNGPSYVVVGGAGTFLPPSAAASTLTLANNAQLAVALPAPFAYPGGSTSSLMVCSNGFVSVASGNGTGATPTVSTMLNATQTGWWVWHDYNPAAAGSGPIRFEVVGGVAVITWDGVYDNGGTTAQSASTFQFQFDTASGIVHVVFQAMSAGGNGYLVGWSPGGPSADHGSMDLSAALPGTIQLAANDVLPLSLAGTTRPVIGAPWTLTASNVPATATLGFDAYGLADPGVPDLGHLGAPGCGQRSSLDALVVWLASGSTHTASVAVPNNPSLSGLQVFAQTIVLVPGRNGLFGGAITSNGIAGLVGTL